MDKINLVENTISVDEIDDLCKWLKTNPRLTKGKLTDEFEKSWSEYNNNKHSLFVSSGSSANLAAFYAFKLSNLLKNNKVILPAVSWSTTVAPAIQLGYEPFLCDCNLSNFGLDLDHLKYLIKTENPGLIVTVNVLGFANDYEEILLLCKENNILLLEDSCESVGTVYKGKRTGTFGDISTFSFYYGHHMSTIEGGMVCTENDVLEPILRSIRCHGWDRDLSAKDQSRLRSKYNVSDFKSLYTFYYPGFNMRCTDLQAFLGLNQLKKLDSMNNKRNDNFFHYYNDIRNKWVIDIDNYDVISNMAYPVIVENIGETVKNLTESNIEHRPLICGSIGKQPFWTNLFGEIEMKNANIVDDLGIYVPNNPDMTKEDIEIVKSIIYGA